MALCRNRPFALYGIEVTAAVDVAARQFPSQKRIQQTHYGYRSPGTEDEVERAEKRTIALCNLPLRMALMNV